MSVKSWQHPITLRNRIPLILIGLGLALISLIVIQQVVAQESHTLKPPFHLTIPAKNTAPLNADSIGLPLDAPIITSQVFDSSYQPTTDLNSLGWHEAVGSGATSNYTWAYAGTAPLVNTVWCARRNPSGQPQLNPATNTYTNGMQALLIYGPVDLRGYGQAVITATYWLDTKPGDFGGMAVSTDGTNFTALNAQGDTDPTLSSARTAILNLSSYARQPTVWIAFYFSSNNDNNNGRGFFIKDTVLRGVPLRKTYMPILRQKFPPATATPTATPVASYRYFYTFSDETSTNNPDFNRWGGYRQTSCDGCTYTYYQDLVRNLGNPGNALTLYMQGFNGRGGAGPRQNGTSLSTATNFEYSGDFYVYNGQLDARYGLVFDASSGTFPGDGTPPMDPYVNYYLLEMRMDTTTRTKVAKWQILRVINGGRNALTSATDLPVSINQGQWHNLKIRQQGGTITFYLNGAQLGSTSYDQNWGDNRRRFGLYIDVRGSNGDNGPFEFFTDNIVVRDLP